MFKNKLDAFAKIFPVSIAIFTMTFGAGNLIYPLVCGASGQSLATFFGFLISSTVIALIGLYLTLDYLGNYRKFLSKWVGFWAADAISFIAMVILGPLYCIPRCIIVSKAALEYFTEYYISTVTFGIFFICLIYFLLILKSGLVKLLGKGLGLINIALMLILIIAGIFQGVFKVVFFQPMLTNLRDFAFGFTSGYNTLDFFAGIFYAHSIFTASNYFLLKYFQEVDVENVKKLSKLGAIFSAIYFTIIYLGFFVVAANFAGVLSMEEKSTLIFQVSGLLFGVSGSFFACAVVLLSCLCASIALSSVFVDYLLSIDALHVFGNLLTYKKVLFGTCFMSLVISTVGFGGLDALMSPVLNVICPILIVVCLLELGSKIRAKLWI